VIFRFDPATLKRLLSIIIDEINVKFGIEFAFKSRIAIFTYNYDSWLDS